ncbi:MAG: hypothetical protein QXM22_02570, partial [Candidatus Bathyarchaeia archaeon]
DVMVLTNHSPKSRFFVEKTKLNVKYSNADIDDLPSFIITDQEQILLSIRKNNGDAEDARGRRERITALWTNYSAFTKALGKLFGELWGTETPLEVAQTASR